MHSVSPPRSVRKACACGPSDMLAVTRIDSDYKSYITGMDRDRTVNTRTYTKKLTPGASAFGGAPTVS